MKFVIYNGQNKFTINNASIPAVHTFFDMMPEDDSETNMSLLSADLYDFRITSTRGAIAGIEDLQINEDVQKEVDEGIGWKQETIH